MTLIIFILVLAALILVHECGHFFVAKFFGIRVDEFGIGFPPRIAAVRHGETEYSINWLFFGGFVRIFGEQLGEGESLPRSFAGKPRPVQALVVASGIAMNLLAAWLLLSTAYMIGIPTSVDTSAPGASAADVRDVKLSIAEVIPDSPAEKAGVVPGDAVVGLQTADAVESDSLTAPHAFAFIQAHAGETVILRAMRDGYEKTFAIRPQAGFVPDDPNRKVIGVDFADVGLLHEAPLSAFASGARLTADETAAIATGLGTFFKNIALGRASFADVSGPVGIAEAGSRAVAAGPSELIFFAALISINLAIINILPIPGLDGGRLLFIAIEAVKRSAISQRVATRLTVAGFSLLAALMVLVTYHDIARLLTH